MRRALAILASTVLAGAACTSKGEAGSPGAPGQSVVSAALSPGSAACPNGGSQFVASSGTTYACNGQPGAQGAQGIQGPPGDRGPAGAPAPPAALVVDATGAAVGEFLGYSAVFPATGTGFNRLISAETWGARRVVVERDLGGVRVVLFDQPRYALADCKGGAFTAAGPSSRVRFDAVSGIYYVVEGAPQTVQIQSFVSQQASGAVCVNVGTPPLTETLRPMVPVQPPPDYVGPLDIVLP